MMLPLRIRKAEVAMADGRLDEAYQQATREDVKSHRKGQRLITRLTVAYEKRSRVHLRAGNPAAALADADRAARLGGNQPDIVALRDQARGELDSQQCARQARYQKIAAAKRYLACGDYTLGAKLCDDVEDAGNTVVGLMQDAEVNRRIVETAIERGRRAVKAAQFEQALEALEEAQRLQPSHADVVALQNQVMQAVTKQIRQAVAKGRLDQAELLLGRVRKLANTSIEIQELTQALAQCRKAAVASRGVEISETLANLKSLKQVLPEARWLDNAIKETESVVRSIDSLRTGPLGSLLFAAEGKGIEATILQSPHRSPPPMPVFEATPVIPDSFSIHLDGAGSFLVMRRPSATIGTFSRSRRIDVPLQGQVGMPTITVERMDDDYFLSSSDPVPVNGKPTTSRLLAHQDQVRLGRRGTMQFSLPNSASTSAAIDFAGIRLANGNARRVILMDDALVIGPQPSAHIQSLALERAMVMHWRNGELRIRPLSRTAEDAGSTLVMDRPHDVDGLSLVVTQASGVV